MDGMVFFLKGVLFTSLILGLMACGASPKPAEHPQETGDRAWLSSFAQRSIALQRIPELAPNTTVYVQGRVAQQAPLLESSLYQLVDETGNIWVRSRESSPAIGESVKIRGTIQVEFIRVEGMDISEVYIQEENRQSLEKN